MAFKLQQMNVTSLTKYYEQLLNLNIRDEYKSLVLSSYTLRMFAIRRIYLECKNIFSSDRKLWHLAIRMRQIS